tara:strand:+ start:820 stop:1413 length:594 start_codon:yes stop_codon:yes gene_type:complete
MTRENKIIEKKDLVPHEVYEKNRKKIRKELVEFKKNRRVPLGPHATFYFENFDTMLAQIQEMLHIEKGGDEQLKDELNAYNPLVPKGNELVTTLMFEIDNPEIRSKFLGKVGGIEEKVFIQIGNEKISANPEADIDRTSDEGKASSVQFLHFKFSNDQVGKFKNSENPVVIGIDHELYNHTIKISDQARNELSKDFN